MRRIFAVLLFLSLSSVLGAQSQPANETATGFNAIQAKDLRADLTFLASDALEGRMSLERGSEVAIQWIAAEFAKSGLKPVSGDSYFQSVPLIEYKPDAGGMRIALTRGGKTAEYKYFTDFVGSFPANAKVKAPVVFAGYGITAPEYRYDDYAGLDVTGKVVLIFDHEPQESDPTSIFNGVGNTVHANSRLKIINAQKHGAVGVLVVSEPNRKHPSNLERLFRIPGARERFLKFPSQALAESELKIPLFTVNDNVAATLLLTSGKTASQLQSAIDATLKPASMALTDTAVEMDTAVTAVRQASSANVIGMIEGSDPALRGETIIFSSHFDHDGIRDGKIFHGADDNGSGTVGVVELARAFAANPAKPKRSILFISFAAEERGLLGSYYYTSHPLRPLDTTRAVINFDMIGRNEAASAQTEGLMQIASDTSNELNLIGTINSSAYRLTVERANRDIRLNLNYKWDKDAALNVFQRSDQFPFAIRNIPAIWWFTGFHPDYHQTTDTVEKINFTKMEKILKLAYLTGWEFANAKQLPQWNPNGTSPSGAASLPSK